MRDDVVVVAIDVGGKANIGWAIEASSESVVRDSGTSNRTLDELIDKLKGHLEHGRPVALGIEAPLYLPVAQSEQQVNSAREGEHNRAWSASSGASVVPLGVHQLAYVLRGLRDTLTAEQIGFGEQLLDHGPSLMIWEAFVTSSAKGDSHEADAHIAITAFRSKLRGDALVSDLVLGPDDRVINIAAAAVLAIWPDASTSLASEPCLVVKPG